jgi:hypothetical protein
LRHTVRIQKENYEPFETTRSAGVKETILIPTAEAQLKPFGTLVFEVKPPEAKLTIQRQGEALREISDKTLHLRGGAYTVTGVAEGYEPYSHVEQVVPGESQNVSVVLTRKEKPVVQEKRLEITDLFGNSKNWKRQDDGFWIHDGTLWLKQPYFTHIFEVLKPKKGMLRQGKVSWRIYIQGDDYIECQLDDSTFYRKTIIGGKASAQQKMPHKADGSFVRLEITVAPDGVTQKIGQMVDNFPGKIEGRAGFDGKFGLRLVN